MSRSGYNKDVDDYWQWIRWRGMVASAIRGKRGQTLLRDLVAALDAMPEKALIAEELLDAEGGVCALGAVGQRRGVDMSRIDPEDYDAVAGAFNIASPLAQEIMYQNDEWDRREPPEQRWERMRAWAVKRLQEQPQ